MENEEQYGRMDVIPGYECNKQTNIPPPQSDKRVPVKEQSHHRATPNNGEEGTLCRVEPLPGTFGHGYSACVLIEYHAIRLHNIIQHHVLFKTL